MELIAAAVTDIGIEKGVNQDSYGVRLLRTRLGNMAFAVLCDGMGGLSYGEVASATVVDAFQRWVMERLPQLCDSGVSEQLLRQEWTALLQNCNQRIAAYGTERGISLGTTAAVLLLTESRYFCMHVGDSRVYEITAQVMQLTRDHSLVAREAELGFLTEEQAKNDPRRNILLKCIGAAPDVVPSFLTGTTKENAVYMLCSDGFWHGATEETLLRCLAPSSLHDAGQMEQQIRYLIGESKRQQENDNITLITLKTGTGEHRMKQGMLLEGKYHICEKIKHSSTGEVCLARAGNKYYAVKVVRRSDAALPAALYTAQHPSLPHLEEVLEKEDEVIFILDWISGSTLEQRLKETGVQPEALVLNWAVQLCDVLLYLHGLPVVHCDVKPSNILLRPDGGLVLIDLSAATAPGTLQKSAVNGTQGFAAPELYTGYADARTDIYALGQTMLVLLTGGIPENMTPQTALRDVCRETFARVILQCVQPLPDDRYPSCAELRQALKSCEADPAVSSRHTAVCPPPEERVTEKLVDTASALLPVLYPEADLEVVETLGFTSAAPL